MGTISGDEMNLLLTAYLVLAIGVAFAVVLAG